MTRTNRGFGLLFWINFVSFVLWGGAFWIVSAFPEVRVIRYIASLISLGIIFPLLGLNATSLLSRFVERTFDIWETLFFTTVFALFLPAFLITVLASATIPIHPLFPIFFTALSFFLTTWFHSWFLETLLIKKTDLRDTKLLVGAFLFYSGFIWLIVSAYPALPDLDPYYWLIQYKTGLIAGQLPLIGEYRPLFASLAYLFHQTADIDLFAYFKYVLPFLSLASLTPLMIIARHFESLLLRLAVFTLPLATASFVLYTLTPIPQSLFNLAFIFFLAAIFQSGRSDSFGTHFYLIVSGTILVFSALYHEMAAIPFILWLTFFAFHERTFILTYVRQHTFSAILLLLLTIDLSYPLLIHVSEFISARLAQVISHLIPINPNFSFPATYVNIDGNSVGWNNWHGIMKYYAYYAGPTVLLVIATLSILRKRILSLISDHHSQTDRFLLWMFSFFFLLAEILPRFFNVAFLPERAWGYAALALIAFTLFLFVSFPLRLQQWFALGILCSAYINGGGAIYINSLKQYLLTPAHFMSAEWIKSSIPGTRIVFSYQYRDLLRVHGQSETMDAPSPDFFSDIRVFDEMFRRYQANQHSPWGAVSRYLSNFSSYNNELNQGHQRRDAEAVSSVLTRIEADTHTLRVRMNQVGVDTEKDLPTVYIYYARPSERNPYAERPYMERTRVIKPGYFCFDRYPERFQRIYALPDDEVVIWKLIE